MLAILNDLVEFRLLPDRTNKDDISLHRDRVLAWVHLISIFTSGALALVSFYVASELVAPILACNLGSIALTYVYKRYGNHILSGNLLVLLLFGVLVSGMMQTGGLYSDNVLWMLLVPITAYLFTERKWGVAWSLISVALIFGLYYLELNSEKSYRLIGLELGPEYFLVSYIGLFGMIIGVITIFVRGNENLLASLNDTSEKLRNRTTELELKNSLLQKQESELRRSNQDLEFFAYVASHDLKEPLRMINVYAKLLDKRLQGSLTERDQEFMNYIMEGGSRMQVMLEDLLTYGKLGRDNKQPEPIDLERIAVLVENNLKLRLIESGGTLYWSNLPTLLGRSTHFIQLFQNLVANGLKFSREGVSPIITISGQETEEAFTIRIQDNGIGIPQEDIKKIFGVFQRLGNSQKFEGSGIGLATVDRIMESLGGSIKVESEHGLGTTFILHFPADSVVSTGERQVSTVARKTNAAPK